MTQVVHNVRVDFTESLIVDVRLHARVDKERLQTLGLFSSCMAMGHGPLEVRTPAVQETEADRLAV